MTLQVTNATAPRIHYLPRPKRITPGACPSRLKPIPAHGAGPLDEIDLTYQMYQIEQNDEQTTPKIGWGGAQFSDQILALLFFGCGQNFVRT